MDAGAAGVVVAAAPNGNAGADDPLDAAGVVVAPNEIVEGLVGSFAAPPPFAASTSAATASFASLIVALFCERNASPQPLDVDAGAAGVVGVDTDSVAVDSSSDGELLCFTGVNSPYFCLLSSASFSRLSPRVCLDPSDTGCGLVAVSCCSSSSLKRPSSSSGSPADIADCNRASSPEGCAIGVDANDSAGCGISGSAASAA